MLKSILMTTLFLGVSAFIGPGGTPGHPPHRNSSDQIIIKFKESFGDMERNGSAPLELKLNHWVGAIGASVHSFRKNADHHVVKLHMHYESSQLQTLLDHATADPDIEYAEVDKRLYPALIPNDPLYSWQWHYGSNAGPPYGMNLPGAWDITTGSSSVVVAVVDTGVLPHPDLVGNLLPGYDMIADVANSGDGDGRDSNATDPGDWTNKSNSSWHGTHVAGTIAAVTNNLKGVAGVAWNSKIVPVRFLGHDGGYDSDLAAAIRWAGGLTVPDVPPNPHPAKVISISAGGPGICANAVQSAISAVVGEGCIVVVAAGNEHTDASTSSPANCDDVFVVGAHGPTGTLASYSNFGAKVDVLAPGGDGDYGVLSTGDTGLKGPGDYAYVIYQGTSMATPHVSGLAALMFSLNPNLLPDDVKGIIKATAKAPPGHNCIGHRCGAGLADARAALTYITRMPPLSPAPVNDNCPSAVELTCGAVVTGSTRRATAGVLVSNCVPGEESVSANVWYVLRLPTATNVRISTCNEGTNFDTMISVFSGECPGSLSCVGGQDDSPSCGSFTDITLNRQSGVRWIMVDGYGAARGEFTLSVQCSPCGDGHNPSPLPSGTPSPSHVSLSPSPHPFSPSRSPSRSRSPSPNPSPHTPSPPLSPHRPSASPVVLPSPHPLSHNDECTTAIPVTCGGSVSGNTLFATVSHAKPNCIPGALSGSNDLWYSLQLSQPTVLHLSTCKSTDFDTMISVFSGSCQSLVCAGGADDGCGDGQTDLVTSSLSGMVFIMVHGHQSSAGHFNLTVECSAVQSSIPNQLNPTSPISYLNNNACTSAASVQCGGRYSSRIGVDLFGFLQPTCVSDAMSLTNKAWFSITLPQGSALTVSTCYGATDFDTLISLFSGSCDRLSCVAAADDAGGQCGATTILSQANLPAGTYLVAVYGYGMDSGPFELSVDC